MITVTRFQSTDRMAANAIYHEMVDRFSVRVGGKGWG
jgi:hypothetical protein